MDENTTVRSGGPRGTGGGMSAKHVAGFIVIMAILAGAAWFFAVYQSANRVEDNDIASMADSVREAGISEDATEDTRRQAAILEAQLLLAETRYIEAQTVLDGVEGLESDYSGMALQAQVLEGQGKSATATYKTMLELYPGEVPSGERTFTYFFELGQLAEKAGENSVAKQNYQQMLDQLPDGGVDNPELREVVEIAQSKVKEL